MEEGPRNMKKRRLGDTQGMFQSTRQPPTKKRLTPQLALIEYLHNRRR